MNNPGYRAVECNHIQELILLDRKPVRLDPRIAWFAGVRRLLSPMAGVTDRPFRTICREHGAEMGFCEFTSASGLYYQNEQTWRLLDTDGEDGPVGIQIFGSNPEHMAAAAALLRDRRLDVLDLNFGCPAKKVVRKCGGSALLADLPLLGEVARQVVAAAAPLPVSAKIRSGWDAASVNYAEVGLMLQELGCVWVTLHGRTRAQKYGGRADWDTIAHLVDLLEIPVVGNGDVTDGASYRALCAHTRCHAAMVARGAIGNPWLFGEMRAADLGEPWQPPSFAQMCDVTSRHLRLEVAQRGERYGCLALRKHIARCFRGYPGASWLRKRLLALETSAAMLDILAAAAAAGDPRASAAPAGGEGEAPAS
jgi:nifR3 family TIM-barrel protein